MNAKNGIANFKAHPPSLPNRYWLHNYRAAYRSGGLEEVVRWWKFSTLPWRNGSARQYIFNYRALMMAQKRGQAWRTLPSTRSGEGPGWTGEFPTGNIPFKTWLKLRFWWPLPRPWRYFQACDCWKYQDTDYIEGMDGYDHPNPPEPEPCGGNRSRYGCAYA